MASYRSYCLTVRPRDGITDNTIEQITLWLNKCDYSVAVLEMEHEARHLHAQIWFNKPRLRGDICKQVQRICERSIDGWDDAQKKVLRAGVIISYSDWYLDYLIENDLKECSPNIINNNPPPKTMEFYPTDEEQARVQLLKTAVDPRFCKMELDYLEWLGESTITHNSVCKYLSEAMFVDRTMKVVLQARDRKALAISLYAYVSRQSDIYLFKDKDKNIEKTEKLLSNLNIQEWHSEDENVRVDVEK